MGNVYLKQGDYENAIKFFDKSLADHRNPDIVSKSIEVHLPSNAAAISYLPLLLCCVVEPGCAVLCCCVVVLLCC